MQSSIWRGRRAAPSFEQVVPTYEFSELVRLGLGVAKRLAAYAKRRQTNLPDDKINRVLVKTMENR